MSHSDDHCPEFNIPSLQPLSTLGMVNLDVESISCETMLANTVLNF